jgi:plastocyanin domain-containing protein
MDQTPRTVVSVLRMHTRAVLETHAAAVSIVDVDATMSDGSRAVLFRTCVDDVALPDADLIGLTAQQAYELAEERGILI